VLVHGGWHGGWCWRKVTPLLRAGGHERGAGRAQRWLIPLDWDSALRDWGITDRADLEWMRPRLTAQPLALVKQARAGGGDRVAVPSTYLHCQRNPAAATFQTFAERAKATPETWTVRTLDTGHDAMITAPDELAELLPEAAN
jgi:hypothetical protein